MTGPSLLHLVYDFLYLVFGGISDMGMNVPQEVAGVRIRGMTPALI